MYGREILLLFAIGFAVNLSNLYCQTVHFLEVEYGQKASLRRIQFPTTSCTTFYKVKLAFDQNPFPLGVLQGLLDILLKKNLLRKSD